MSTLKRYDGTLLVDNRAAETPAFPSIPSMGRYAEVSTIGCRHCGGCWVLNPLRTRAREYCKTCNLYICDTCFGMSKQPDYVHRTIDELHEMVASGRYAIAGGTVHKPILIPIGAK